MYTKELKLNDGTWNYTDTLDFQFDVVDTLQRFDILLTLNHSTAYRYQNCYVKLHTAFPSGKKSEKVVSLEMADKFGRWNGECNSKNCTLQIMLQEGAAFNEMGTHTILIEQFMRVEKVYGIRSIKFELWPYSATN